MFSRYAQNVCDLTTLVGNRRFVVFVYNRFQDKAAVLSFNADKIR